METKPFQQSHLIKSHYLTSKFNIMKYFTNCKTIDEIKSKYKKLAKQFHPDCGGDTKTMQEINTEYAFICAKVIKGENLTNEELNDKIRLSEEYKRVIDEIIPLVGITIEVVGNWIWVTGNTYPVKDKLKGVGFFYASKKVAWYYRSEEFKVKGGKKSLDEIRAKYGSENISGLSRKAIS